MVLKNAVILLADWSASVSWLCFFFTFGVFVSLRLRQLFHIHFHFFVYLWTGNMQIIQEVLECSSIIAEITEEILKDLNMDLNIHI